jgi:hypothetical protein
MLTDFPAAELAGRQALSDRRYRFIVHVESSVYIANGCAIGANNANRIASIVIG